MGDTRFTVVLIDPIEFRDKHFPGHGYTKADEESHRVADGMNYKIQDMVGDNGPSREFSLGCRNIFGKWVCTIFPKEKPTFTDEQLTRIRRATEVKILPL